MDSIEKELAAVRAEVREQFAEMRGFKELPLVLSPVQACRELMGISLSKLKQMVRDGEILRCKVGKTYGYPRDEVMRIAAARVGPKDEAGRVVALPPKSKRKKGRRSLEEMEARVRELAKKSRRS